MIDEEKFKRLLENGFIPGNGTYDEYMKRTHITISSSLLDSILVDYLPPSVKTLTIRNSNYIGEVEIVGDYPMLRNIIINDCSVGTLNLKFSGDFLNMITGENNSIRKIVGLDNHLPRVIKFLNGGDGHDALNEVDVSKLTHLDIGKLSSGFNPEYSMPSLKELIITTRGYINIDEFKAGGQFDSLTVNARTIGMSSSFMAPKKTSLFSDEVDIDPLANLSLVTELNIRCHTLYLDNPSLSRLESLDLVLDGGDIDLPINMPNITYLGIYGADRVDLPITAESLSVLKLKNVSEASLLSSYPKLKVVTTESVDVTESIDLSKSMELINISINDSSDSVLLPEECKYLTDLYIADDYLSDDFKLPKVARKLETLTINNSGQLNLVLPKVSPYLNTINIPVGRHNIKFPEFAPRLENVTLPNGKLK